ncbi:hypothetical protein Moror_6529 [Moniliophthora roreri MCA 2997]|uniref:C3H1-type domain-containing protein n=1 Tax=Moniliophthora roreri (strain MCA 2997) TaxID=1381753 RepID=V2XVP6_MONRO|nr:hypothetical protein Moror_6529 [Moniliophthora roreri MCA 2997]
MSGQKNPNPPYKKYQCRYFDESGRPLGTSCNQGDNCRFVHPTDPNWPGLKCHPFNPRRPFHESQKDSNHPRMPHVMRTGGPLPPQTDLFQRQYKKETDDDDANFFASSRNRIEPSQTSSARELDSERINQKAVKNPHRNARDRSRTPVKPKASRYPDFSSNQADHNQKGKQSTDTPRYPRENTLRDQTAEHEMRGSFDTVVCLPGYKSKECANRLTELFRNIAQLSNQAVQDTVKHAEDERSLQNINQMSATLAKISADAASAVATPLADTIINHVRSKERVEADFSALEEAWQRLFDAFVAEIAAVIDRGAEAALTRVREQVKSVIALSHDDSSSMKRKASKMTWSHDGERDSKVEQENGTMRYWRGRSRSRDPKRRKMDNQGTPSKRDDDVIPRTVRASFDDILSEIKGKLDQQSCTLHSLQEENYALKRQLCQEQSSTHNVTRSRGLPVKPNSSNSTPLRIQSHESDRYSTSTSANGFRQNSGSRAEGRRRD